jgi:hydrogenase maturation factor
MSPLFVGRISEVWEEEGVRRGMVVAGRARTAVWLEALPEAKVGDDVVVSEGVAIARLAEQGGKHVSRDPR